MIELEILKRLISLEAESRKLKIRIKIWKNEIEKQELIDKDSEIEIEIVELKNQLEVIDNKTSSEEAKFAIIRQLNEYISEINKAGHGLKLSRNQGLMIENSLFNEIYRDLHFFVTNKVFGVITPAFLQYTYSNENSIDINELSEFLSVEVEIVKNITNPNYLKLRQYFKELEGRIIEKFIK